MIRVPAISNVTITRRVKHPWNFLKKNIIFTNLTFWLNIFYNQKMISPLSKVSGGNSKPILLFIFYVKLPCLNFLITNQHFQTEKSKIQINIYMGHGIIVFDKNSGHLRTRITLKMSGFFFAFLNI